MSTVLHVQGFIAEQAVPEQVQAAGNCAVAALAALIMHLRRIKAFDELAKSSTILPYGVRAASDLPVVLQGLSEPCPAPKPAQLVVSAPLIVSRHQARP